MDTADEERRRESVSIQRDYHQVEVFSDTEAPPAEVCGEEVVFVVVADGVRD